MLAGTDELPPADPIPALRCHVGLLDVPVVGLTAGASAARRRRRGERRNCSRSITGACGTRAGNRTRPVARAALVRQLDHIIGFPELVEAVTKGVIVTKLNRKQKLIFAALSVLSVAAALGGMSYAGGEVPRQVAPPSADDVAAVRAAALDLAARNGDATPSSIRIVAGPRKAVVEKADGRCGSPHLECRWARPDDQRGTQNECTGRGRRVGGSARRSRRRGNRGAVRALDVAIPARSLPEIEGDTCGDLTGTRALPR
jgi:hypothetical protein